MAILTVNIGGNRERLRKLAHEIEVACDGTGLIDLTVYCEYNGRDFDEAQLMFSNDDIEGREDLDPNALLVDAERSL